MKSQALESYLYGDPSKVLEIRQSQQINAAKRSAEPVSKRPTLTLKLRRADGEWSEERKKAEALFDIPAAASR